MPRSFLTIIVVFFWSCWFSFAKEATTDEEVLLTASQQGDLKAAHRFLARSIDLEVRDSKMGWTPLMWAANNGHPKTARLLLDYGAQVNAKDIADQTPLKLAIRNRSKELLHLLLNRGAEVTVKGKLGDTLLPEAVLVGNTEAVVELLKRGVDVNAANDFGSTPLHAAAICSNWKIATILLNAGANVNARNKEGATPLLVGIQSVLPRRSFWQNHEYGDATRAVKVLLSSGATVDEESRTIARENGMKDISRLLERP